MESYERLIDEKNLIKSLSEIDLEKDVKTVNENIYKHL